MTRPIMQHYQPSADGTQHGGLGDDTGGNAPCTLWLGDCLERMGEIPDGSVDMILADLPYGTTACKWDTVIPFEPLWAHYKRVTKPNAAIVLTAIQPFTSALVMSNPKWFRYSWVWEKPRPTNFMSAKWMPLMKTEDVCVFGKATCNAMSKDRMAYFPQGVKPSSAGPKTNPTAGGAVAVARGAKFSVRPYTQAATGYPQNIIKFPQELGGSHPTQKPVALMEYLIRTYTNPGETVLDNTMGSGTTGVACVNTGRDFIGIEKDAEYFAIAERRIAEAQPELFA